MAFFRSPAVGGWLLGVTMLFNSVQEVSAAPPMIIAHRGASAECPENTLASVKRGWEVQADAVEIDVYPTRDGRVVVIHDSSTSRTTGRDFVVTATSSVVVRELDAGKWKSAKFAGERIPFLEEVLATLPKGKQLFIELKGDVTTVEPVARIIRDRTTTEGIVVISFNFESLRLFKELMPTIPVYWLRGTQQDPQTRAYLPHTAELLDRVQKAGFDGINVQFRGVTKEFVDEAKQRNLPVFVWTVNDPREAKRLAELGVAGITTDKPCELRSLFWPKAR